MKQIRLSDISEVIAGQSPSSETYNTDGEGLPFYQGKADFGELYPKTRVWCNKPIKIAQPNDILISVRAPVGPTNICKENSCIGRGLSAIRVKENAYFKYVLYYLRSIEKKLAKIGNGSTFAAITQNDIRNIKIPLPPLPDQKRIAAILDKTDVIRRKRQETIRLLDEFLRSVFLEMFGDPVRNEKGWEVLKLSQIGEINRGVSKHRPRNAPELLGGKYPLIQTGDVANSGLYIKTFSQTYSEVGLNQSKMWKTGTLCITIAANIAKTGILAFDACFPDSVVGFIANEKTNNIFVHFWFTFLQSIIEANAPESAQKNINLSILNDLNIIVPLLELQNKFAQIVEKTEQQKQHLEKSLAEMENNFNSLMQRAFRGEI
jgi:type I restriction enzyme S subunit